MKSAVSRLKQSEGAFQAAVIDYARRRGWRVAHFRKAQNAKGVWRTPVAADGAGWPDLVLVRRGRMILAELKAEKGRLDPEQLAWRERLEELELAAGGAVLYRVWRLSDWPEIEELLGTRGRPAR